jgi:hypothetical protein
MESRKKSASAERQCRNRAGLGRRLSCNDERKFYRHRIFSKESRQIFQLRV